MVLSHEERFISAVQQDQASRANNTKSLSRVEYDEVVNRLIKLQDGEKRSAADFKLLKMYEVIDFDNGKLLKRKGTDKRVVATEDIFEILKSAHAITGHGGRDVMRKHLEKQFYNISLVQILTFVNLCEECQLKRCRVRKSIVVKPILSSEMNSRCQVDLIDFQSQPDGVYKFIMNYQDHLTKYVCLRALKSKTAEEVAENLVPIFCTFGAPNILHCDNGKEFANKVIKACASTWSECRMVHGKPRHSQSQGSVERANRDVQDKLACWLRDHKPRTWSQALPFVQFQKNTAYHSGIGRSPYEAMFGNPPKCGLRSLNVPPEMVDGIESEEQLEVFLNAQPSTNSVALPDESQTDELDTDLPLSDSQDSTTLHQAESDYINLPETPPGSPQANNNQFNPCQICELDVSFDESCSNCTKAVHYDDRCSVIQAHGSRSAPDRICMLCRGQQNISKARKGSKATQAAQARKMTLRTAKIMEEAKVGDTVTIPVPDIDRGRGDHRNVLGVILSKDNDFFKLGTEFGRLNSLYSRNQFSLSKEKFVEFESVLDKDVGLREAARLSSSGSGQGFFKCHCATKCKTNKCKCKRANVLCNSKCHGSNTCCNK